MNADHWMRRRLTALALNTERVNLVALINALANTAIRAYACEPIAAAWPHIAALVHVYIRDAADRGAFHYFGIESGADLVGLPPVIFAGGWVGTVGVSPHDVVKMIMRGGTRSEWVNPRDLEFTAGAR